MKKPRRGDAAPTSQGKTVARFAGTSRGHGFVSLLVENAPVLRVLQPKLLIALELGGVGVKLPSHCFKLQLGAYLFAISGFAYVRRRPTEIAAGELTDADCQGDKAHHVDCKFHGFPTKLDCSSMRVGGGFRSAAFPARGQDRRRCAVFLHCSFPNSIAELRCESANH